jgi:hypothetical protein
MVVIAQQTAASSASVTGNVSAPPCGLAAMTTPANPSPVASHRHRPTISPRSGLDIATTNSGAAKWRLTNSAS